MKSTRFEPVNPSMHSDLASTKMAATVNGKSLMLTFFNYTVLLPISSKLLMYCYLVLLGSLSYEYFPMPKWYISDKHNVFNQYFVKLSWGWTSGLLALFIISTSLINTRLNPKLVLKNLSRLAVSTAVWFVCVRIVFEFILTRTGQCSLPEFNGVTLDRRNCRKQGLKWNGFDISGHTFLLTYCLLVINEEVNVLRQWITAEDIIEEGNVDLKDTQKAKLQTFHKAVTPVVYVLTIALALLTLLWELMLVTTSFYFHSISEKFLGYFVAVFFWFGTYEVWYRSNSWSSPGKPYVSAHDFIEYIKDSQ